MISLISPVLVAGFTFLNRLRGGGFFKTPISSRLFCAPFVSALALLAGATSIIPITAPWKAAADAVLFGLCWLAWAYPPWSDWIALGYGDPTGLRPATTFEKIIDKMAFGNAAVALWLRMLLGLLPMAALFNPRFALLSAPLVLAYAIGWATWRSDNTIDPIMVAELFAGAFWGCFVAGVA